MIDYAVVEEEVVEEVRDWGQSRVGSSSCCGMDGRRKGKKKRRGKRRKKRI